MDVPRSPETGARLSPSLRPTNRSDHQSQRNAPTNMPMPVQYHSLPGIWGNGLKVCVSRDVLLVQLLKGYSWRCSTATRYVVAARPSRALRIIRAGRNTSSACLLFLESGEERSRASMNASRTETPRAESLGVFGSSGRQCCNPMTTCAGPLVQKRL